MITKYLPVFKRKNKVIGTTLWEEVDSNNRNCYWVQLDFDSEEEVALPTVDGVGLKFILNITLTEEELNTNGLIKTLSDGSFTYITSTLQNAINNQLIVITNGFEDNLANGYFFSTTLGITVDARRSALKNDLQNVQGLISNMTRTGTETITYVGYSESKSDVTLDMLTSLTYEMEDYALSLYQAKWTLESQICACTTADSVLLITWTFI